MTIFLDDWQEEILNCNSKRILLCKGRQIGGTTIFARKAAERLASKEGENIIVVSITEDQAQLVIVMTLNFLETLYPKLISKKKTDTTKSQIKLKNGSVIKSRPVGTTGNAIRGFTGGILWLNEGSRLPEFVFEASKAVLLTTNGEIWMDSTPFGKKGYFYESFLNKNGIWKVFYKNSEEVMKNRPIKGDWTEEKREGALRLLEEEKEEMTDLQFKQEYLGLFSEDIQRLFSDDLIQKTCRIKRDYIIRGKAYLGVDIAGLGKDINSFEVIDKLTDRDFRHLENKTTKKQYTTQTTQKIIELDNSFKFKKIGVDDGGVGFGVFSELMENKKVRHKVVALNNASRPVDSEGKKKKRILKEEMYINLLRLAQKGYVKLLRDNALMASLASVQVDESKGKTIIFGKDTHITEGLIRALYLAVQDKSLNLWAR